MKLTPHASIEKNSFNIHGFTDLGKYTPESQTGVLGDHGLVIIFQPFMGTWLQPVGAFLSKSAAPGYILAQILLEAIILIENNGFFVDGIVCDGANWNRAMWREFGCTNEEPWCPHPTEVLESDTEQAENEKRYLHFFSDFPHLMKNLRNWIVDKKNFNVSSHLCNYVIYICTEFFQYLLIQFVSRRRMERCNCNTGKIYCEKITRFLASLVCVSAMV